MPGGRAPPYGASVLVLTPRPRSPPAARCGAGVRGAQLTPAPACDRSGSPLWEARGQAVAAAQACWAVGGPCSAQTARGRQPQSGRVGWLGRFEMRLSQRAVWAGPPGPEITRALVIVRSGAQTGSDCVRDLQGMPNSLQRCSLLCQLSRTASQCHPARVLCQQCMEGASGSIGQRD